MAKEVKQWITVNGQHVPIFEGQSKQDAIDKALKHQKNVDKDEDKKEKQISQNKKEAEKLNKADTNTSTEKITTSEELKNITDEMIKNKDFSKFGDYLSKHRKEFGLSKSEDAYMAAYQIINGDRELKLKDGKKPRNKVKDIINKNEEEKTSQLTKSGLLQENAKYAPSSADVTNPKDYFKDTSVKVNSSLSNWTKDADKTGIPSEVYRYMDNSSINNKLRKGTELTSADKSMVDKLDKFTRSGSVPKGTILYSGLTSDDMVKFWDNPGDTISYPSFLSTSPDPVYARGYGMNTDTVMQITVSKDTNIGKTYYEGSTGTEGILGRNNKFKIIGESFETINGERVRVIKAVL